VLRSDTVYVLLVVVILRTGAQKLHEQVDGKAKTRRTYRARWKGSPSFVWIRLDRAKIGQIGPKAVQSETESAGPGEREGGRPSN
jgi:hypothetical protein